MEIFFFKYIFLKVPNFKIPTNHMHIMYMFQHRFLTTKFLFRQHNEIHEKLCHMNSFVHRVCGSLYACFAF